ncbi:hypothetical protein SAICODRAFT_79487 [Saitoella complicata NRRL Y-17804]|uniref:Bacterial surface antigen (D15) domain-containing protein n=1 Tax=Saitoella complicata (strain BCRC 22490 / CBS 7301 / JCM 7358 / NBRC 10748 / NRRL Y-17804) TaxID=698492 RepID=A0A0E9NRZ4_SAICN|nr:uncharacterized protein SAICODRAFT_79487 [Saitoella complicata NRRL Y-17804]ODQ53765.1 hypothetical protein SAICODRAFT_79487 [Saitoella complicata NRRL Y-17804]GAO52441.1 hypothetical protein G7K_6517-t1 [Saitoella complicata NRRL Y-17804]
MDGLKETAGTFWRTCSEYVHPPPPIREQVPLEDAQFKAEREARVQAQIQLSYERAMARLSEMIDRNASKPAHISSLRVLGANKTRPGFLQAVLEPHLAAAQDPEATFATVLNSIQAAAEKLERFDIFHGVSVDLDTAARDPHGLAALIHVREKSRWKANSGTEMAQHDQSAYARFTLRNICGGAELLEGQFSYGTVTRNAFEVRLESPVNASPDTKVEVAGWNSSTDKKLWAGHEEVSRGGAVRLRHADPTPGSGMHELGWMGVWRTNTGMTETAPHSIRANAGDSVKSAIYHTYIRKTFDHPLLPTSGTYLRLYNEIAGASLGPLGLGLGLGGDTHFLKSEIHSRVVTPLHLPTSTTLSLSLRAGGLWGLRGITRPNDRFFLGGPSDVRGFAFNALGPRENNYSLGGDIYLASGLAIATQIPYLPTWPARLHTFLNAGSLSPIDQTKPLGAQVREVVGRGSVAVGVGVVCAVRGVARVEVNLGVPVVTRGGERAVKGVQVGLGVEML